MADNDIILSERESRLAVVLFEIMKPQIEKLIISKVALHLDNIKDETSSEFDLSDHVSEIKDIVEEIVRYDLTFTTTVD